MKFSMHRTLYSIIIFALAVGTFGCCSVKRQPGSIASDLENNKKQIDAFIEEISGRSVDVKYLSKHVDDLLLKIADGDPAVTRAGVKARNTVYSDRTAISDLEKARDALVKLGNAYRIESQAIIQMLMIDRRPMTENTNKACPPTK